MTLIRRETAGVETHSPNAGWLAGYIPFSIRGGTDQGYHRVLDSKLYWKLNYLNKSKLKSVQTCGEFD